MSKETAKAKNILIELGKNKAAQTDASKRFGVLGSELSQRYSKGRPGNQSYTWRGGRNGQGKPS